MTNPYLEAWRNENLDTARDLAIYAGENIQYYDETENRLKTANPETRVASLYDEYLASIGALNTAPQNLGSGKVRTGGGVLPLLVVGGLLLMT